MGRSGNSQRGSERVNAVRAERRAPTFQSWKTRRRLLNGRDNDQVIESARMAAALGDRELAVDLVAELLKRDIAADRRSYVPGDVMRKVLASLIIDIDTASREYVGLAERVMPAVITSVAPDAPLRTLARRDLHPLDHSAALREGACRVLDGEPYNTVRNQVVQAVASADAQARDRELDWLIPQLQLRYEPGEDGLGTLWAAAAARVAAPPAPGTVLSREATALAVLGLAVAGDTYEAVAALADALQLDH
jgi:hypothetical protein